MHSVLRIIGIIFVFALATGAWLGLSGITHSRTADSSDTLQGEVHTLWGRAQVQPAPKLIFEWKTTEERLETVEEDGKEHTVRKQVEVTHRDGRSLGSTQVKASLSEDLRRKGLVWYPLYDIDFSGQWTYTHDRDESGWLAIQFEFPDRQGFYDDFSLVVDGVDRARELTPENGIVAIRLPVTPGQEVSLAVAYRSRGMDSWRYSPAEGVGSLENFSLDLETDFADIDFPSRTLSPTEKTQAGAGWALSWTFDRVVTGHGMGMVVPHPVQPGELATQMSLTAPVSLLFFFVVIYVLSILRGIDIHPLNYLLIAGAFFAFHLLFAYSADRLPVAQAFGLASVVSVVLVVSYLRLVVSTRFALVEAGLAQLVYLVCFSLAHFWQGFTGLTVTVLSILTLFLVMQLTGRIQWSEVLQRGPQKKVDPTPTAS